MARRLSSLSPAVRRIIPGIMFRVFPQYIARLSATGTRGMKLVYFMCTYATRIEMLKWTNTTLYSRSIISSINRINSITTALQQYEQKAAINREDGSSKRQLQLAVDGGSDFDVYIRFVRTTAVPDMKLSVCLSVYVVSRVCRIGSCLLPLLLYILLL